jgi:hypothetical protein
MNFNLLPIPPFDVQIVVLEEGTNLPISNAQIRLSHPQITHQGSTNGLGQENLTLYYQDNYELVIGKWGYQSKCSSPIIDAGTQSLTILLKKGFYDDFSFDFGWSVIGNAETGLWERAEPNPTTATVFDFDVALDCSQECMVTGNGSTPNTDQNDVDNGFTTLISPIFNVDNLATPHLNYARSFYCFHGPNNMDDTLEIMLSNGLDQVLLEQIIAPQGQPMTWEYKSIPLNGLLPFTNTMQLFVRTADYTGHPNITEAAFDHFSLTNEPILDAISTEENTYMLYPNPGQQTLHISGIKEEVNIEIYQMNGGLCLYAKLNPAQAQVDVSALSNGFYVVVLENKRFSWVKVGQ